jgi:iron complex transport system substrate-binding protein
MEQRRIVLAFAVVAAALVVTACDDGGGGGDDAGGTPGSNVTFAPGSTPRPNSTPASDSTTYPVTLRDGIFRSVTIDAAPQRVAALSATALEYVYIVGGTSVTRPAGVSYPPEVTDVAEIGSAAQPDIAAITAQSPDLIIADAALHTPFIEELEGIGVPVLFVGAHSVFDVMNGLEVVGHAINQPRAAQKSQNGIETQVMSLSRQVPESDQSVLIVRGAPGEARAATAMTYAGDIVNLLAGNNAAADLPDPEQTGYVPLTPEQIAAAAPDIVLVIAAADAAPGSVRDAFLADPAWASTPAAQSGRVHEISEELFVTAPGPRVGEALDVVVKLLYPETFD